MSSLGEDLPKEIARVRQAQDVYKSMHGEPGINVEFAIMVLEIAIQEGVEASISGDVARMMLAYEDLKACE